MGNQTTTSIVDRLPRADYGEMVRLVIPGTSTQPVIAQAKNISPSGMLVDLAQPWAVGTEVQCDVPLPGGARTFRGRVARVQAQRDSGSMGIQFLDLSDTATTLLQDVVTARTSQTRPVDVWFDGRRKPTRLEATVTERGIRLTSPLPLLRFGSTIRFGFAGEQKTSIAAGVLSGIAVVRGKRGEPASLELDVTFVRPDAAAGELDSPTPESRMRTELLPYRPTASEKVRRRRILLGAGAIVLGLAGLVFGIGLAAGWLFGNGRASATVAVTQPPQAQTAAALTATGPAAPVVAQLPSSKQSGAPNAVKLARLGWQRNAPQLHVDGDLGTLVIPITGAVQGSSHQLEDPRVLIITAPRARPQITAARYSFEQAGVTDVKVATKGAGLVTTIQLSDPPPSVEQVRVKPGYVEVTLRSPTGTH